MTTDAVSQLADLLLSAANEGRTLDTLDPALVPADDAAAYRVHNMSLLFAAYLDDRWGPVDDVHAVRGDKGLT
jgi:hypothetical protein